MHCKDSKYLTVFTYLIPSTALQGRYYHLSYKWTQTFETERMNIIPKLSKQVGEKSQDSHPSIIAIEPVLVTSLGNI